MATAIHHSPPGSFKSFTLIQRFAIPALKEGRTVVTNVRGFNDLSLVKSQFPEVEFPDSASIIYVDCSIRQNIDLMARFFHWVPFKSVIIIDEVQQVYPNRKDFKPEALDYLNPDLLCGYVPEVLPEPRPSDIFIAFEKQRHYNWDIYLSTPNIAKVKTDIRQVAEWAYRHRNISGVLPWKKNCWYEHQHDPEFSGKLISHRVGAPNEYKADTRVFKCYSSTATGEHTDNQTGRNIFQDPKILFMLGMVCLSLLSFVGLIVYNTTSDPITKTVLESKQSDTIKTVDNDINVRNSRPDNTPNTIILNPTLLDFRKWSYAGIDESELIKLPFKCEYQNKHVICPVSHTIATSIKRNYYCIKQSCKIVLQVQYKRDDEAIENNV